MKKFSFIGIALIALALVLAGCDSGVKYDNEFDVTSANFESTINSIRNVPGNYLVNLSGDVLNQEGITMETAGVNITVKGTGANRITWRADRTFSVKAGKLTLENIAISPVAGSRGTPLTVEGGTVEIKDGVTISNPENIGVEVRNGGVFIMSGGVIENCGSAAVAQGGGKGSITISGGTIRNVRQAVDMWGDSSGATLTITGGTIQNTASNGINPGSSVNATVTISGGIIENCENGIGTGATGVTINISGGTIRNNTSQGIGLWGDSRNGTLNISGGTISGNADNGIMVDGSGHTVAISGGTISGNTRTGISVNGSGHTFTVSGVTVENNEHGMTINANGVTVSVRGTFRNNTNMAVAMWDQSANVTLNITGGEFTRSADNGSVMWFGGSGNRITMSNGTVTSGGFQAVGFGGGASNSSFTLSGGQITGRGVGIEVSGTRNTVTISGGTVRGNTYSGISVARGTGHTITKTGGTVSGPDGALGVSQDATGTTTTGF